MVAVTQPGRNLGRYELVRWLGEGGFAEVWLARDEEDGLVFLAMEYVAGGSLEALVQGARALGKPFPPAVAVRLMADVRAGLHCDVSPQNILVTPDGVPKLIDSGIAKARGAQIDRRADVWALAAVTYELLEGRRVVEGPNEVARLKQLVDKPVVPSFARTPPALASVLERAFAFHPRDRQATAEDLRAERSAISRASAICSAVHDPPCRAPASSRSTDP